MLRATTELTLDAADADDGGGNHGEIASTATMVIFDMS
jgi:hypothetical protein